MRWSNFVYLQSEAILWNAWSSCSIVFTLVWNSWFKRNVIFATVDCWPCGKTFSSSSEFLNCKLEKHFWQKLLSVDWSLSFYIGWKASNLLFTKRSVCFNTIVFELNLVWSFLCISLLRNWHPRLQPFAYHGGLSQWKFLTVVKIRT